MSLNLDDENVINELKGYSRDQLKSLKKVALDAIIKKYNCWPETRKNISNKTEAVNIIIEKIWPQEDHLDQDDDMNKTTNTTMFESCLGEENFDNLDDSEDQNEGEHNDEDEDDNDGRNEIQILSSSSDNKNIQSILKQKVGFNMHSTGKQSKKSSGSKPRTSSADNSAQETINQLQNQLLQQQQQAMNNKNFNYPQFSQGHMQQQQFHNFQNNFHQPPQFNQFSGTQTPPQFQGNSPFQFGYSQNQPFSPQNGYANNFQQSNPLIMNGNNNSQVHEIQQMLTSLLKNQSESSKRNSPQLGSSGQANLGLGSRSRNNESGSEGLNGKSIYESSIAEVSYTHSQLDRKVFRKLHPWAACLQGMFGIMDGIRTLNQLDDTTIVRAVCKYSATNFIEDQSRCSLLLYAIFKTLYFNSANKSTNPKDHSNNVSILKSLVNAIDCALAEGTTISFATLDNLAVEYKFSLAESTKMYPESSSSGSGRHVRSGNGNGKSSNDKPCFAWNRESGCNESPCHYNHKCSECGSSSHPKYKCQSRRH
jgi:hypothetical protein